MPLKKLREEEKATTESLIAAIERKDRRFRVFQTLFMVGTFVALIFIISAQQRTLSGVEEQLKQAKEVAQEEAKRSTDQQDTVLRRLDCMSVFFSQTNRTNLSIENIDRCTLSREGNLQEFFTQEPGQAPETTKEQQNSNLAPSTTAPQTVVPNPDPSNEEVEDEEQVEPRPPATLNVPLLELPSTCVPLLNLCVE